MNLTSHDEPALTGGRQTVLFVLNVLETLGNSGSLMDTICLGVAVIAGAVMFGEMVDMGKWSYAWWRGLSHSKPATMTQAMARHEAVGATATGDRPVSQVHFDEASLHRVNRSLRWALERRLAGARSSSRDRRHSGGEAEDGNLFGIPRDAERRLDGVEARMNTMLAEMSNLQRRIDDLTREFSCSERCNSTC